MIDMKRRRAQSRQANQADAIKRRIADLEIWLQENGNGCDEEQAHLDEGTSERAYWHYGYLMALKDALQLLQGKQQFLH